MSSLKRLSLIVCCAVATTANASNASETLTVVAWNVESGGAQESKLSERIGQMSGVDIWGLSEVKASWKSPFELAAEDGETADFEPILGNTGGGDRLLIIYNTEKLERLGHEELHQMNLGGHVRAPLVAHFRMRSTEDEFLFVVNHLYRSRADRRHRQATMLNQWASDQELPVITVGDFNFDWKLPNGETDHDAGYDNLTANDVFTWVRPATLIRTNFWDRFPNSHSVLDFVFVANAVDTLTATSEILRTADDFPDDDSTSDHRPVRAHIVWTTGGPSGSSTRDRLLERIERMASELAELKAIVEELSE